MILGTEFYAKPPFTLVEDSTFNQFSSKELADFEQIQKLSAGNASLHFNSIQEIYEKHQDKTIFTLEYVNCLFNLGRNDEAKIILTNHLKERPQDLDIKMALAMSLLQEDNNDEVMKLMGPYFKNLDNPPVKELTESQFLMYCNLAILFFINTYQKDKYLKVYSWTLSEKYEAFNKNIAMLMAGALVKPMPQKFEEIEHKEPQAKQVVETYFHLLALNKDPYHSAFKTYHGIYIDEISLQDIRAIEALTNKTEIEHDIRWLIKNEFEMYDARKGVFDPAGGLFAFILASSKKITSCLPDLLATLRVPNHIYFDLIFKQNFFQYILNPFYHLGLLDSKPLMDFIADLSNSEETRNAVASVLAIMAKEHPELDQKINGKLGELHYDDIEIPDQYEIIENKIPQLLQHFIDIPVNYFEEEDEEPVASKSTSSFFPESIQLPGGGIVSKPNSLESAVFSNFMLMNTERNKEMERYAPPPKETMAPLKPIVKLDKIGRNDPCPCGSGKKYKKCCLNLN